MNPRLWCTLCQQFHAQNHNFGPARTTKHIEPRKLNQMWQYIDHGTRTPDDYRAAVTSKALKRERYAHG